jgi:hypothetical protein
VKNNRSSRNWLIDATLFGSFVVLFFLELTGVVVHQWLGMAAGALAAYHLVVHWEWVRAVTQRFFGRTTWEARMYLLVDILLFAGLGAIVLSGLVISTWLNLSLGSSWLVWSAFHTLASQATLLLLVFKIAIHGQWITKTARRLFSRPSAHVAGKLAAATSADAASGIGRRDLLRLMGVVGAASTWAILRTIRPVAQTAAELISAPAVEAESLPAVEATSAEVTPTAQVAEPQDTPSAQATRVRSTTTAQPTLVPSTPTARAVVPSSTPTARAAKAPTLCTKLCPRGQSCNYPGRCHSYVDRNRNGHCDWGEC